MITVSSTFWIRDSAIALKLTEKSIVNNNNFSIHLKTPKLLVTHIE